MEELTIYEASDIIKNLEFVDKNDRELRRYELFISVQSMTREKVKLEDIMKLPWDEVEIEKKNFKYDENEAVKLEEKGNDLLDMLNSGKFKIKKNNDLISAKEVL